MSTAHAPLQKNSHRQTARQTHDQPETVSEEPINALELNVDSMTPETAVQLQRTHGNAFVQRLVNGTTRTPFQSSLIQRAGLRGNKRKEFDTLIAGNSSLYKRVKEGSDVDLSLKNFNFVLIKKMLSTNGLPIDDTAVRDAAALIAKKLGDDKVVEVAAPDTTTDPLEKFDEYVDVQSGVDIDSMSDADEWKKFILNGIALEGYTSGMVNMTMTDVKKQTKKTLISGLQHRTQKAANRSVWYKWNGKKVEVYALANHIRNDNTKYQRLTSVSAFLSSWKLEGGEASPI